MFPVHHANGSPTSICVEFVRHNCRCAATLCNYSKLRLQHELQRQYQRDPAVHLHSEIIKETHFVLARKNLCAFINSLARLELAFTRLDVMNLASSCQLFPFSRFHYFGSGLRSMPSFQPQIGEFGLVSYLSGKLVGWESLGVSCHVRPVVHTTHILN